MAEASAQRPLTALIAEFYHDATLADADMSALVPAVEEVRSAAGPEQSLERAAQAAARTVASVQYAPVYDHLAALRTDIEELLFSSSVEPVRELLHAESERGWQDWLTLWVHGLWHWPDHIWIRLTGTDIPVPAAHSADFDELAVVSRAMIDSRWSDTRATVQRIAALPWLRTDDQVTLVETLAMIELFVLIRPTAARELLEQAERPGAEPHRVCAGWAEWWRIRATSETDDSARLDALDRSWSEAQKSLDFDPHYGRCWTILGRVAQARLTRDGSGVVPSASPDPVEQPEYYYRRAMAETDFAGFQEVLGITLARADGRPDDTAVQALLQDGMRIWPERAFDVTLALAEKLDERRDRPAEAEKFYQRAIELDPTRVSARTERGYARLATGDIDTARQMFTSSLELAPESFDGVSAMAWLCEQAGEWADALHHYEHALAIRPEWDAQVTARMGRCLIELGHSAEAEQILTDSLTRHPDDGSLSAALADVAQNAYRKDGDTQRARTLYDTIRRLRGEPYEGEYRNLLGHVAYWVQDYAAAESEYRRAATAEPANAVYHSNLAQALEARISAGESGLVPEAIRVLERAAALAPDDDQYATRLSELRRRAGILNAYGPAAAERLPVITPIRVLLGEDLLPYILTPERQLQPDFQQKIDEMRARVQQKTGVWLPGIRFSTIDNPVPQNIKGILFGAALKAERILLPGDASPERPAPVQDRLLGWVEELARAQMAEFVGHDEVAARLGELDESDLQAWAQANLDSVTVAVRRRIRADGAVGSLNDLCRTLRDQAQQAAAAVAS